MTWARLSFVWRATPGAHTVSVRATDAQGNVQTRPVPFNEQGYLYRGVVAHPVTVA